MHDELSARQTAIRLRLAGEAIENICQTLQRSHTWFHKWWRRYLESGPEGTRDVITSWCVRTGLTWPSTWSSSPNAAAIPS